MLEVSHVLEIRTNRIQIGRKICNGIKKHAGKNRKILVSGGLWGVLNRRYRIS